MVNKTEDKPEAAVATEVPAGTDPVVSSPAKKSSNDADGAEKPVPAPVEEKPKMRAVLLSSFGGLKGVKMGERPQPQDPKEGQVTVKVSISGVNFQDLMVRLGVVDNPPKTPFILGTELIGTVTAVGPDVSKVKVNDLIFGLPEHGGGWAEYVNLDEKHVWKVTQPKVGLEKLGSTLAYLVADLLLERAGSGICEGANVLIHSAGGSVGLALRDLAKLKNVNVIGIASQAKFEKLEGFANLIERGQDYVAEVKKLHPTGLQAVFDPQGGEDCARGISLLAPWGTYVLYGSANIVTGETKSFFSLAKSWWQVEKVSPLKLYEENKGITGLHLRHLIKSCPDKVQKSLERVWALMAKGDVNPVQDLTFHFEQVTQGMQRMHDRKNVGKILIIPDVPTPTEQEAAATEAAATAAAGDANPSKNGSMDSNNDQSTPPSSATK